MQVCYIEINVEEQKISREAKKLHAAELIYQETIKPKDKVNRDPKENSSDCRKKRQSTAIPVTKYKGINL